MEGLAHQARLAKTLLLCNARTVDLYRREYQPSQEGKIGITLVSYVFFWGLRAEHQNVDWVEPIDESKEAKEMAQLTLDYVLGMVSARYLPTTKSQR
jgi:hypothetical protein